MHLLLKLRRTDEQHLPQLRWRTGRAATSAVTDPAWSYGRRSLGSYAPVMSTSPLSPDDIRAAAEVHAELGPEYRDAVVESFLEKIDDEIAARIDARLAAAAPRAPLRDLDPVTAARRRGLATGLVSGLALGTIVVGLPLSWFAADIGGSAKLWFIWAVIAIVYGAGAVTVLVRNRRRRQQTAGQGNESSQGGHRTRIIPRHS